MSRVIEGRRAAFKVGYEALQDKALLVIAGLWTPESRFVVVHGGGNAVTARATELTIPTQKIEGQRVTDERMLYEAAIPVFTDINRAVDARLFKLGIKDKRGNKKTHGVTALHLANTILFAERDEKLGLVAKQPVVNYDLLEGLLEYGFTPVVAPLSRDKDDKRQILNTNGDKAWAAFPGDAFSITKPEGVLNKNDILVSRLTRDRAEDMIARGEITDGMVVKVRSALTAAETRQQSGSGERVFITNSDGIRDVFDGRTAGTLVLAEE